MRAAILTRYGGDDAITVSDFPEPTLQAGEVLVEVHAASVNPIDIKIRDGKMKMIYGHKPPRVLGEDIAGKVVRLGPGASKLKEGDEVWASTGLVRMGAFAEYTAVPESDLSLKPKRASFAEAAALPLVALTARQAFDIAGVGAGSRVFVRAGSGGIGVAAIQLGKAIGAHVATTTSAGNLEWVRALGADEVLDYRGAPFEQTLSGYDLALETSTEKEMLRSFAVVREGGYLISIGDVPDARYAREAGLNVFLRLVCSIIGRKATRAAARSGKHYRFFIMKPNGEQLAGIAALVDAGKIQPQVERTFPLADAQAALAHVARGRTRGKIVIQIRD
jgi:NADPH:quinone reductase-like Zn-dependent oxidoreductase